MRLRDYYDAEAEAREYEARILRGVDRIYAAHRTATPPPGAKRGEPEGYARSGAPFPAHLRAPCLWYRRDPNGPLFNVPVPHDVERARAAHDLLVADPAILTVHIGENP